MPCPASAGPMGGAGLAFPASICRRTTAFSFFATGILLVVLSGPMGGPPTRYRGPRQAFSTCRKSSSTGVSRPKKDTSTRTLPRSISMLSTVPTKSLKGPSMMRTFWPGLVGRADGRGGGLHPLEDLRHFLRAQRGGRIAHAHKTGHARGVAHHEPGFLGEDHLHHQVAGVDALLDGAAFAFLDLDLFDGGDDDVENFILHPHRVDALLEVVAHFVFLPGVAVDDIPGASVPRLGVLPAPGSSAAWPRGRRESQRSRPDGDWRRPRAFTAGGFGRGGASSCGRFILRLGFPFLAFRFFPHCDLPRRYLSRSARGNGVSRASIAPRKMLVTIITASTTAVRRSASSRVGQVTLRNSPVVSLKKRDEEIRLSGGFSFGTRCSSRDKSRKRPDVAPAPGHSAPIAGLTGRLLGPRGRPSLPRGSAQAGPTILR